MFGTLPDRPAFSAYAERLRARPAYIRAKAIDNALIAAASPAGADA
jgi:glutathione S-transferase